jgi:hypothetical protein
MKMKIWSWMVITMFICLLASSSYFHMLLSLTERRALAREKVVNELINKARVICATCAGAGMDILKVDVQLKLVSLFTNALRLEHSI